LSCCLPLIRMSGKQQDKSPAEQRAEITKLAAREGFHRGLRRSATSRSVRPITPWPA